VRKVSFRSIIARLGRAKDFQPWLMLTDALTFAASRDLFDPAARDKARKFIDKARYTGAMFALVPDDWELYVGIGVQKNRATKKRVYWATCIGPGGCATTLSGATEAIAMMRAMLALHAALEKRKQEQANVTI